MNPDEIREAFATEGRRWDAWRAEVLEKLAAVLGESNRLQSESEERCKALDQRTEQREAAYDERNDRAEACYERQTVAWERIASALERIAEVKL